MRVVWFRHHHQLQACHWMEVVEENSVFVRHMYCHRCGHRRGALNHWVRGNR